MGARLITIYQWAAKWGVPVTAVHDLLLMLGAGFASPQGNIATGVSEAAVQSKVRLEAAQRGVTLWRNNVGVLKDINGRPVRYGLCNDSPQLNAQIKSGDLIGIRPVLVTHDHIGTTIGQFVSRECKSGGWKFKGTDREKAQFRWAELVTSRGGDAAFTSGEFL